MNADLRRLAAATVKEARVLLRDKEGLAILFVMPVMFVVIMSLALQDFFRVGHAPSMSLSVVDIEGSALGTAIAQHLAQSKPLEIAHRPGPVDEATLARIRSDVRAGKVQFALIIPTGTAQRLTDAISTRNPSQMLGVRPQDRIKLELASDPAVRGDHRAIVQAVLERVLLGVEIEQTVAQLARSTSNPVAPQRAPSGALLALEDAATDRSMRPSSTQQNVPAYSLLAMFLLVVPLAGTFIKERDQGSLLRLRAMPVPSWVLIGGKVLPYFAINLLQLGACLAVGRFLIPALGGDALVLGNSIGALLALAAAASLAAIGFALLIAMVARTPEQATAFGATAVLLMAALGGIMVPTMLMPATLQSIALGSPMGWALDGFLGVFVRSAGLADVLTPIAALMAFAAACLCLAMWRFNAMMRAS